MADDFSPNVAALAGDVPIALLPVRLEARFFDNATELRVRIFPDQIHVDAHEPELTARERDAGMAYWRERFATPDPDATRTSPWTALCRRAGRRPRGLGRACADSRRTSRSLASRSRPWFRSVPLRAERWSAPPVRPRCPSAGS